jgi:hypothetical protein
MVAVAVDGPDTACMIDRMGWAFYAVGVSAIAAGLFAFPWLSAGSHGCYAVAGGDCTISNGNTTAALVLLVIAVCAGGWRLRDRTTSLALGIVLAASGIGIGFCVFTFNLDAFTGPTPVLTGPPTHEQLRAFAAASDWGPSTGFVLTLAGGLPLVAAALAWSFSSALARSQATRARTLAGVAGIALALVAALGAWLPWVHVAPASAVLDTDHGTVGMAAAVLLVASIGYLVAGGGGWTTALTIAAGLLCTVAVYQWLEVRWQQADLQPYSDHVVLASGIWLSLAAGILSGAAAVAVLLVEAQRRSRGPLALAGGFLALLLAAGLVSHAVVDSRQHSCGGTYLVGTDASGHSYSGCASNGSLIGVLYENRP